MSAEHDGLPVAAGGRGTTAFRWALGVVGVVGIAYGAWELLSDPNTSRPADLGLWLLVALIVHDGILAPVVTVVGFVMARLVPSRARAFIQGGLVAGALVTSFVVFEIYRERKSEPGMALLQRDYTTNLLVVLGVVAALTALLYVARVVRDRRAPAD